MSPTSSVASRPWRIPPSLCAGLLLAAAAAGCGDRRFAEVSGTVTSGGKPVEGAFIVFAPDKEDEVRGVGSTDAQGRYRILRPGGRFGAPRGPNTVSVHGGDAGGPIPPEYGTASKLRFDVRSGRNTFDIDIPAAKNTAGKSRTP
ncbi:MAG: carboxypeptidase-like regulatory domain-containing protein [Planctomycetota bacterium]